MTSTAEETIARLKEQAEAEATDDEQEVEAEETEADEETPPKKHSDTREYVVLTTWAEAGRFTASTSKAAVEALGEGIKSGHKYVAVPVRNWNEHEAEIKQVTTISIK